jgi:hypothetical protein
MGLVIVKGNLLTSDCNIIGHQANCQRTMGSGIAKDIREMFPEAYDADCKYYPTAPESKFGKVSYGISIRHKKIIANLYGQLKYWKPGDTVMAFTDVARLRSAIMMTYDELIRPMQKEGQEPKFGVPYFIGCGRGGGNWLQVSAMLNEVSDYYGSTIYGYSLN